MEKAVMKSIREDIMDEVRACVFEQEVDAYLLGLITGKAVVAMQCGAITNDEYTEICDKVREIYNNDKAQ